MSTGPAIPRSLTDLTEAIAGQLAAQLTNLSFPTDLSRIDADFITQVDAIQANQLALGKPFSDTNLGMKVIEKLPNNRFSKSDAIMNNPTWAIIRQRLRLVSLSERNSAQAAELCGQEASPVNHRGSCVSYRIKHSAFHLSKRQSLLQYKSREHAPGTAQFFVYCRTPLYCLTVLFKGSSSTSLLVI